MVKTVYLLEDNDAIRKVIEYLLEEEGYAYKSFSTVTGFYEGAKNELPDVYLLDVMLPDGNGLEVCDEIKKDQRTKHVPVLIMSANTDIYKMHEGCAAEDYIGKPFDIDKLAAKIDYLSGKLSKGTLS